MIEVFCKVKHDPDAGQKGDCIRACIASILEIDTEALPNFADAGDQLNAALIDGLAPLGYAPWWTQYDGSVPLSDILAHIGEAMPTCHYVLFGRMASGMPHAVVCKGGTVVHNPSWAPLPLTQCSTLGTWAVLTIAKA